MHDHINPETTGPATTGTALTAVGEDDTPPRGPMLALPPGLSAAHVQQLHAVAREMARYAGPDGRDALKTLNRLYRPDASAIRREHTCMAINLLHFAQMGNGRPGAHAPAAALPGTTSAKGDTQDG